MGRKLVLTGTKITDLTAPRLLSIDALESDGSLFLLDPMHPAGAWGSGVPANSTTLPNLFGGTLSSLGAGGVDSEMIITGAIDDGVKGRIERSDKGGLHVIVSQANVLAMGDGVRTKIPDALATYFANNSSHSYYWSVWDRLTRAEVTPSFAGAAQHVVSRLGRATPNLWYGDSGAFVSSDLLGNAIGPRYGNAMSATAHATKAPYSAGPDWGAADGGYQFTAGQTSLDTRQNKFPSFVFYRVYVEDLTVSGRTYNEVSTLDQQLYAKEVLTEGGRYYGDTFTAPSTVA